MKKLALFMAVFFAAVSISGCSGKNKQAASVDFEVTTDGTYPVKTDKTITYWVQMHESVAANYNSLNETRFGEELIKQTGINVEFIHPPITQIAEKFNLLIASREFPDIIEWGWDKFTGGPQAAIDNDIILPLNEVFDKVAPNFSKYLTEKEEIAKTISTDEGNYFCFPMFRESDYLNTFAGPMFRKDLLDKAGLSVPETISEWETALYAFKDMGVEVPLMVSLSNSALSSYSAFLGAYGVPGGFYVENGKVNFGPANEEAMSNFIRLMAKWYQDGILDPNFVDDTNNRKMALGASGTWGVAFGSCGGNFGAWIPTIQKSEKNAEFVPAKFPVLTKGETPKFGQKNFSATGTGAAITTQCKDVELAARLLDFGYSKQGFLLYNFGTEGESYEMVDGVPTYTDMITNTDANSGQPMSYMIAKYARASYFGPFMQAEDYMKQYAKLDVQKQGIETWMQNSQTDYALPAVTLTTEENNEYSTIMADIDTYREEQLYKFITGTESLDKLPEYFATLKTMGIERAIEINQAAYERYNKR